MIIGIVGCEKSKFTPETKQKAYNTIADLIVKHIVPPFGKVVSGACHLGGIDIWAIEVAKSLGVETEEFPPRAQNWSQGYMPRNIQIARASDIVYCITIKEYPDSYIGTRFGICYHCNSQDHVKSGGCWTAKYCKKLGKQGHIIVI